MGTRPQSIELQRALYRLLGIKPDDLVRVIIDIGPAGPPTIFVATQPEMSALDEVLEEVRLSFPKVERVRIVEGTEQEFELPEATEAVSIINELYCTFIGGSGECNVIVPHVHRDPKTGNLDSYLVERRPNS